MTINTDEAKRAELRARLAELLVARAHLKARIATERPLDHSLIRQHAHACREVEHARFELAEWIEEA